MRICTSHMPEAPCDVEATFHSTRMAPGAAPLVSKIRSLISTAPTSPGWPTWKTGAGEAWLENAEPDAMIKGQISPVMRMFLGTLTVEVMT